LDIGSLLTQALRFDHTRLKGATNIVNECILAFFVVIQQYDYIVEAVCSPWRTTLGCKGREQTQLKGPRTSDISHFQKNQVNLGRCLEGGSYRRRQRPKWDLRNQCDTFIQWNLWKTASPNAPEA
jgi:hypothetical protein